MTKTFPFTVSTPIESRCACGCNKAIPAHTSSFIISAYNVKIRTYFSRKIKNLPGRKKYLHRFLIGFDLLFLASLHFPPYPVLTNDLPTRAPAHNTRSG